jgi:hypothetical protein
MDTKLTLSLNKSIIERAKKYAQKKNISLSKLIESYLQSVTSRGVEEDEVSPLVKSLSGIVKLPKNFDIKKGYSDYLSDKYKE